MRLFKKSLETKKKPEPKLPPGFVPQNRLEELLVAYGKSPETDANFYREFLASDLYILGGPDSVGNTGNQPAGGDTKLNVRLVDYSGEPVVPVYSSLERLTQVLPEEYLRATGYLRLNVRTLLELMGHGTKFALNPGHMVVKTFSPDEVAAILDGTIFQQLGESLSAMATHTIHPHEYPKGVETRMGRPKNVPTNLTNELAEYFRSTGDVDQAFLGEIFVPSSGQPPHLMLCISLSKNANRTFDQVCADLEPTLRKVLGNKELLDIFPMTTASRASISNLIEFYSK